MQRATDPRQLPELVANIVRDDGLWWAQQMLSVSMGRKDFEHPENIRSWLDDAKLWWVDHDACDLVEYAAPTMPAVTLTRDLMSSLAGFIAFARPLSGLSEVPDQAIRVDYVSWYPSIVEDRECVSIVAWQHTEGDDGRGRAVALGRSDWPFGDVTDEAYPDTILETAIGDRHSEVVLSQAMLSIIEDRRWLAAIWQLASQPGLMASAEVTADRASQKRIFRRGGTLSPVRVINLPHRKSTVRTGGSREYHHRWLVGMPDGFWAKRAYGPGHSLRKAVWILPFMKGPKGAPMLKPRPTVHVLRDTDSDLGGT
jgi:hypothetical protein